MAIDDLAEEFKERADTDAFMFGPAEDGLVRLSWTPRPRTVLGVSMEDALRNGIALYEGTYKPPDQEMPMPVPPGPPEFDPGWVQVDNLRPVPGEGDGTRGLL